MKKTENCKEFMTDTSFQRLIKENRRIKKRNPKINS